MQENRKKVGILGGTFNPIHYGHLIIAEAVRERFCLDKILFIPSGMPPHKADSEVIEAEHRYNMVQCSVNSNTYFEASRTEIDRVGYTYTVDTLARLKSVYGESTDIYFIIGADVIPELTTWKDFPRVFEMCEFIAVSRPANGTKTYLQDIAGLKALFPVVIHTTEAPLIEISSTGIRERLSNGKSIRYLVPQCVEKYIYENGLYKG